MINKLIIFLSGVSLCLFMTACGGGGGGSPTPTPTKAVVILETVGTPPTDLNIGGLQTDVRYTTTKGLSITDSNVIASGVAAGATLFPNTAVSGIVTLGNITMGGAGFVVGQFATLTFTIAPNSSPTANDFAIVSGSTIVSASDDVATDISNLISVKIKSVTLQ